MEKYKLWDLIKDNKRIVIPCYQRDYAQGRKENDINYIREGFVKDIHKAIKKKAALDLNLIFGSSTKEEEEFTPVDGQQRLTTLFLIHWYIAIKSGNLSDNKKVFKKFTYKTRQTSTDFFDMLIQIEPEHLHETKLSLLSEQIQNNQYFFNRFAYDPTVKSSLCTLDEIDKVFKEDAGKEEWDYLVSGDCNLTMSLIDMKKYNLTDTLYLKMNGRGKPLTDYENFKSWLIGYIENTEKEIGDWKINIDKWDIKLDTDWLDLFWNYKDDSDYLVDQEYMRYFNGMIQLSLAEQSNANNDEERKKVSEFSIPGNGEELRIPLGRYEEDDLKEIFQKNTNIWFTVLEKLHKYGIEYLNNELESIDFFTKDKENIFRLFIGENITYKDRLRFYGLYKYLLYQQDDELNKKAFINWMRVVRNIVEDTNNSAEGFIRMVGYINDLSKEGVDNVYSTLKKWESEKESKPATIKHEIEKASFILSNNDFETEIRRAENHPLFKGKIVFLLALVDKLNPSLEEFEQYVSIASNLFNQKGSIDNRYTLIRALFAAKWEPKDDLVHIFNNQDIWRNRLLLRSDIVGPIKVIFDKLKSIIASNYTTELENYVNYTHVENPFFDNLIHYKSIFYNAKITEQLRIRFGILLYIDNRKIYRIEPTPIRLFNKIKDRLEPLGFISPQQLEYLEDDGNIINEENRLINSIELSCLILRKEFNEFNLNISIHLDSNRIEINYEKVNNYETKPDLLPEDILEGVSKDNNYGNTNIVYNIKDNSKSIIRNNEIKTLEEFADEITSEIKGRINKIQEKYS